MKTIILSSFIFLISIVKLTAQNITTDINLKSNLDLFNLNEPYNLWLNFLNSKNQKEASKYWNTEEIEKYSDSTYCTFTDLDIFSFKDIVKTLQQGIHILNITQKDSLYKITSEFRITYPNDSIFTVAIFYVYAKKDNRTNELKLYNPLPINLKLYTNSTQYKNIKFTYPKTHNFNKKLAKKQYKTIKSLASTYHLPLNNYNYIFCDDMNTLNKIKGYDYKFSHIGFEFPSGNADVKNKVAYQAGNNEYAPHEVIHLLINEEWTNTHGWFIEGFCTYYGGAGGKELDFHINKLSSHLIKNPDINLNNMLDYINLDDETDYRYVLGGYFIKLAYEKGGSELVLKLMNQGKSEKDFYTTIENVLGIKREDLNSFVRINTI